MLEKECMKIAIRLDDITADMDWNKFDRFKGLLDKYQVKPLLGVVPFNQDKKLAVMAPREDFKSVLLELQEQGWSIALHGFNHLYRKTKGGLFPLNRKSEFVGLSLIQQEAMLKKGREALQKAGLHTDIFMAPSHTFDKVTEKALVEAGFRYVTDGFGPGPFLRHGIVYLPIAASKKRAIQDKRQGVTTFVVHVNTMKEKDFAFYEELFANHRERVVDFARMLDMQPQKQTGLKRCQEYIMANIKYYIVRMLSIKNHKKG